MHGWYLPRFVASSIVLSSLLAGGALAEQPSPASDAHACVVQPEAFLAARLGFWLPRLNLADWKVSILLSHAGDLKPKTLGNIHWDAPKKTAVIRVLDASGYRVSCREALPDMEMTLVHELVHLELSSLPRSPASRREEEFAVNRIAEALIRLDRQKENLPGGADADRQAAALVSNSPTPRTGADTPALTP
jgi:hypothetical protein